VLIFLFICLLVIDDDDDSFLILLPSSSSVDTEIEPDVDTCEFDGIVTDNGILGTRFGDYLLIMMMLIEDYLSFLSF
jgi:hypothetical protein